MKESSLQILDPRCKLLMMACLSTAAMITDKLSVLALLLLFNILTLLWGKLKLQAIIGQLKGLLTLIFSLFIIQCFFNRAGEALWSIGAYTVITKGGFYLACLLCLRFLLILLSAQIILQGKPRDYLLALVQLKLPYDIAFSVMAGIHFLPILKEEAFNVFYSVQLRGTELKNISFYQKIKLYGKICLPILINAVNRSKDMAIAMEARGLRAYPQRTYLHQLSFNYRDMLVMIFYPLMTIFICYL
ncbi:MAG: energy-coupling factor transporter transmembrane component T [Clostridiales bacterium]